MIKIQSISKSSSHHLVYSEFHPLQRFGYACLTYYPAECEKIAKINSEILDLILKFKLENFPKEDLEPALIEYFVQMNWRLYSIFREVECQEIGISVVLVINNDTELTVIPFGRFICGIWDEKGLHEIGLPWENFRVKSMQELKLLGNLAEDIKPNIIHHKLENRTGISIIPPHKNILSKCNSWNELIGELESDEEEYPHLILSNGIIPAKTKKRLWKK